MTTAEMLTRDLLNAINDAPLDFYHAGTEYTGTRGQLVNSEKLMEGGFLQEPDLAITACMIDADGSSVFSPVPRAGDRITVDGVIYRIQRTSKDEFGVCLQLDLETAHK